MKEKIKTTYLILGIPLLILVMVVLAIWISKQVNWEFLTFDKKECISEHLYFKSKSTSMENLSDEEIKRISQIWNLDEENLLAKRENEKISYEKCIAQLPEKEREENIFAGLFECAEPLSGHITWLGQLIENNPQKITNSIIKELTSEGICPRPSLLK